jgi:hypothetical protein
MSKTTLRKRIALVAVSAITAGLLSVVSAPVASAARQTSHTNAGGATNDATLSGTLNGSMFTSVVASTGTGAAVPTNGDGTAATQKGLLNKDSSSGTAQSATILAGGQVALYAPVSTASAFTATGGSFSAADFLTGTGETIVYGSSNSSVLLTSVNTVPPVATTVAVLWTAPTTPGTYTVSLLTGFNTSSTSTIVAPTIDTLPPTLSGSMLVTVVAASAGGTYSSSRSACSVQDAGSSTEYSASVPATDSTTTYVNEASAYIAFDLNDAYTQNLSTGSIVVTATNGAFVNIATGTTLLAGTSSTAILSSDGTIDNVRVSQPTAGAPITTTVTITYNGTTVCTKTITIRGAVAKLTVGNIGTQALSAASTDNGSQWMYQKTGIFTQGQFTVLATDSAGNLVSTPLALGSYSAASGIGTQIVSATVNRRSASADSSTPLAYNYGGFGCGSAAGQASIAIKFTDAATGKVTTSDAFTARCADTAVTYAVSLDKSSYLQGDVAKATVQFLDSKGNKANNMVAIGANSWILPYMTAVDSTITSTTGASAVSVTGADGSVVYTFTVGTTTAAVAGTYTGVVSFTSPALGVNQTPTYKLSTGGDTTSNADVLKSIVALIASINKQIQALQKLILKR